METGVAFSGGLGAFGQRALDVFGARLVALFLINAAVGVAICANHGNGWWVAYCEIALLSCLAVTVAVLTRRSSVVLLAGVLLVAGLTAGLTATGAAEVSSDRRYQIAAWFLAGIGGGIAVARGLKWGLAATVITAGSALLVEVAEHGPFNPLVFAGGLAYCFGGAGVQWAARRGFWITETALAASGEALTAQRVAEERWRSSREQSRRLHDTVLSTLTVLAHGGAGLSADRIRESCRRDLEVLGEPGWQLPGPGRSHEPVRSSTLDAAGTALRTALAAAEIAGIQIRTYVDPGPVHQPLGPGAVDALGDALVECVSNVRRHAGVDAMDITVSYTAESAVIVVVDEGRGFDIDAVDKFRLGLRVSVVDRMAEVGGQATILSRPGRGTSVVLRVPLR